MAKEKSITDSLGKPLSNFVEGASHGALMLLRGVEDTLRFYRRNKIVRNLPQAGGKETRKSEIRKKNSLKRKKLIQVPWHIFD